jgi:hypothetical protein
MNAVALDYFIYSPYNMVADLKMLCFFKNITPLAFRVLLVIFVFSIWIRNFGVVIYAPMAPCWECQVY